ncbi:hypothetical protein X797_008244 [Metarhizium robertsii]|uniref:Uncharacterized protein n=1 Tax=Metarhizium robertsii TaxID=568076 RepID=A0A0A1USH2_9HYPO|nr:hypothetical protein X797_008244 [Metarhizium robertsii]
MALYERLSNDNVRLHARRVPSLWLAKRLGRTAITDGADIMWYQEATHKTITIRHDAKTYTTP